MNLPEFLGHVDGEIRVKGTRIGLYDIVRDYRQGHTAEQIHDQYDHIPVEIVQGVISFYLTNRPQVDAYVDAYQQELEGAAAAAKPSAEPERIRRLLALVKQADEARGDDPEWATLNVIEKLHRLGIDPRRESA